MKARILVCAVNDGDSYTVLQSIADEGTMDANDGYLSSEIHEAKSMYGNSLDAYGFVDIEIPDDVIAQVIRRHASAGPVAAVAVEDTDDHVCESRDTSWMNEGELSDLADTLCHYCDCRSAGKCLDGCRLCKNCGCEHQAVQS